MVGGGVADGAQQQGHPPQSQGSTCNERRVCCERRERRAPSRRANERQAGQEGARALGGERALGVEGDEGGREHEGSGAEKDAAELKGEEGEDDAEGREGSSEEACAEADGARLPRCESRGGASEVGAARCAAPDEALSSERTDGRTDETLSSERTRSVGRRAGGKLQSGFVRVRGARAYVGPLGAERALEQLEL